MTVLVCLVTVIGSAWAVKYQSADNTLKIGQHDTRISGLEGRASGLEAHYADMQSQMNRIEDNSRQAIGLPPMHK